MDFLSHATHAEAVGFLAGCALLTLGVLGALVAVIKAIRIETKLSKPMPPHSSVCDRYHHQEWWRS